MTLDQLMEEWRKDASVDTTELGNESLKIPELHSKYLKLYFEERRKLKALEFQSKDLSLKKYEYYNGRMSQEELDELNWNPFVKKLINNEIDMYLNGKNKSNFEIEKVKYKKNINEPGSGAN